MKYFFVVLNKKKFKSSIDIRKVHLPNKGLELSTDRLKSDALQTELTGISYVCMQHQPVLQLILLLTT